MQGGGGGCTSAADCIAPAVLSDDLRSSCETDRSRDQHANKQFRWHTHTHTSTHCFHNTIVAQCSNNHHTILNTSHLRHFHTLLPGVKHDLERSQGAFIVRMVRKKSHDGSACCSLRNCNMQIDTAKSIYSAICQHNLNQKTRIIYIFTVCFFALFARQFLLAIRVDFMSGRCQGADLSGVSLRGRKSYL